MNHMERLRLVAESGELREMLSMIPRDDVIERKSLESRLQVLEKALERMGPPTKAPIKTRLTFRGRPVIENRGIFAEFGANAVGKFSDAVAGLAAAMEGPLSASGPIPNRERYQLLITGTALGSFGFELEHHPVADASPFSSRVEDAMERAMGLLEATTGSDDDLAEAVAEADPRVVNLLRDFLKTMADNEAVCSLEFGDRAFRFKDVGEIRRGADRLSEENLHEQEQTFNGTLHGILPQRRNVEFHAMPGDMVMILKVGMAIPDPEELNSLLYQPVKIKVHTTRVGNAKPKYVLTERPALADDGNETK